MRKAKLLAAVLAVGIWGLASGGLAQQEAPATDSQQQPPQDKTVLERLNDFGHSIFGQPANNQADNATPQPTSPGDARQPSPALRVAGDRLARRADARHGSQRFRRSAQRAVGLAPGGRQLVALHGGGQRRAGQRGPGQFPAGLAAGLVAGRRQFGCRHAGAVAARAFAGVPRLGFQRRFARQPTPSPRPSRARGPVRVGRHVGGQSNADAGAAAADQRRESFASRLTTRHRRPPSPRQSPSSSSHHRRRRQPAAG